MLSLRLGTRGHGDAVCGGRACRRGGRTESTCRPPKARCRSAVLSASKRPVLLAPLERRLLLMLPLRRLLPHSPPPPAAQKGTCLRPLLPLRFILTAVLVIHTVLEATVCTIARSHGTR